MKRARLVFRKGAGKSPEKGQVIIKIRARSQSFRVQKRTRFEFRKGSG